MASVLVRCVVNLLLSMPNHASKASQHFMSMYATDVNSLTFGSEFGRHARRTVQETAELLFLIVAQAAS